MKVVVLIMAGGCGERFWPRSRRSTPKQFLCLTNDGKSMIRHTAERILPLASWEDIYISTNADYKGLAQTQLPELPQENILCEPVGRNTAPCIGLGAVHIAKKYTDAVMVVLPSDQLIKYVGMFHDAVRSAVAIAEAGENLVTIGITPSYPETGYGYIQFDSEHMLGQAYAVTQFTEKPDLETAKRYLATERYLWNSGIFIWKCSTLLDNICHYLPSIAEGLVRIQDSIGTSSEQTVLEQEFAAFPSVSIDYGIMEKTDNIYAVPGVFGWDDVGSWLAMERLNEADKFGNVINGDTVAIDVRNCTVQGNGKFIAMVGVEDLIVVDSEDATLICAKNATQDVKKVLEHLRLREKAELL